MDMVKKYDPIVYNNIFVNSVMILYIFDVIVYKYILKYMGNEPLNLTTVKRNNIYYEVACRSTYFQR